MSQHPPELHGSGFFGSAPESDDETRARKRERVIRHFLPLAAAISEEPDYYARFMVSYVGDSDPEQRGLGRVPEVVRRRLTPEPAELDYSCTFFAGASYQGDLISVRGRVWAEENLPSHYFVALSDGDHEAQEPHILRVLNNNPRSPFGMQLGMMDERTRRNWPPDMVPDRRYQWMLTVKGQEPESREAVLNQMGRSITFHPIDALHEAISRVRKQLPVNGEDLDRPIQRGHLTLVHSQEWGQDVPQ